MKKKRAKALAKLCGYHTHHPRKLHAVPTGAKRIEVRLDPKGEKIVTEKDMVMFVNDKERFSYRETKRMFKRGELK